MSGHSHFKTVKATKDANDAKKGKIFSKLARVITIAVREKGPDTITNASLKTAIEKAKEYNMPKENIERAIKKGTGELVGESLEEFSFEALGPGGIAIIIEGITDNKNRTISEIKGIVSKFNGKITGEGAVRWMFERKGIIIIEKENKTKEDLELLAIEAGAEDVIWKNELLEIYTKPEELEQIKKILEQKELKIKNTSIEWAAKEEITISEKDKGNIDKLFESLDENDAIQDIYSNLKL